jgi:hypothetical protein
LSFSYRGRESLAGTAFGYSHYSGFAQEDIQKHNMTCHKQGEVTPIPP